MTLTARQKQAINTKQHIFETAMEIFSKKNFDQVTINEICKASGVSTGAFYHHFQSKEHLLLEEYNRVDKFLLNATENLHASGCLDRILEYVGMYVQSADDAGLEIVTEVYRVWLTLRKSFPVSYETGTMSIMFKLVEEAQKNGELKNDIDPKQFALDILTIARGVIYHWCQVKGAFDLKEKATLMVWPYIKFYSLK